MQSQQQLHHQQQQQSQHGSKQSGNQIYQPSDSEFSFELCGAPNALELGRQRSSVQRSISQPECANEKTLLR